jgi:catechol 2,3-dioxygenase-like lactoylglutathione lyase family enzyme
MAQIEHLAIRSRNPEKLATYYQEIFGWKRIEDWPGGAVHLSDGRINIAVLPLNGNPSGLHHFGVHVDDLAEVGAKLEQFGEELPPQPLERPLAETRLTDLEGNQIDLSLKSYLDRFGGEGQKRDLVKAPSGAR